VLLLYGQCSGPLLGDTAGALSLIRLMGWRLYMMYDDNERLRLFQHICLMLELLSKLQIPFFWPIGRAMVAGAGCTNPQ